jgi:ribose transport system substrate-binding protein
MNATTPRRRALRTVPAAIAFAAVLVLGLASCSSSGNGTAKSANDPAGGGSASGSAGDSLSDSSSASGGFQQAESLALSYSKAPTSIGITQPVGKPIPSKKTIVLVGGGASAGGTIYAYDGFKQAASVLGWTIKEIQPQEPTPQLLQQALNQAIQLHPDAVAISAVEQAPIVAQLKKLQSMHIPVIETYSPDPVGGPITMQLMDATAQARLTTAVADKALADMGQPGEIGMIGLQGYQVVQTYSKGFSSEVAKLCPSCTIKSTQVPLASLGTTDGTDIVNFLRANPGIKALFVGYDGMDSNLFSAAKAAGVTLPKVYSSATLPTSIENLASGALTASAPIDYYELGWRQADAFARIFTGQTASAQQQDVQYPRPMIWSKSFDNVPAAPTGNAFPSIVASYQAQYKKLWGK